MCSKCCTRGVALGSVAISFIAYTLLFLCLVFIQVSAVSIFSSQYMNNPENGDYVKAALAFQILGLIMVLICLVMWCVIVCCKKYDGRTVPNILNLVFHLCAELFLLLDAIMITMAANGFDITSAFAVFAWMGFLLFQVSFGLMLGVFICADQNKEQCCG
ncbi:uncharacterized protein LOC142351410 [Convolutriloba macropyga]|uniref:uncharacterized protein LOC142351410 n=1 Tax=Convolutriloba macropyga TaxID=536237 RepID=UPI003F52336B